MQTVDWLTTPQQLLLETTGGYVFHDDSGELSGVRSRTLLVSRRRLALLACQWRRLELDQVVDSTDVLSYADRARGLASMYQ